MATATPTLESIQQSIKDREFSRELFEAFLKHKYYRGTVLKKDPGMNALETMNDYWINNYIRDKAHCKIIDQKEHIESFARLLFSRAMDYNKSSGYTRDHIRSRTPEDGTRFRNYAALLWKRAKYDEEWKKQREKILANEFTERTFTVQDNSLPLNKIIEGLYASAYIETNPEYADVTVDGIPYSDMKNCGANPKFNSTIHVLAYGKHKDQVMSRLEYALSPKRTYAAQFALDGLIPEFT